jgi:hypothetical protein
MADEAPTLALIPVEVSADLVVPVPGAPSKGADGMARKGSGHHQLHPKREANVGGNWPDPYSDVRVMPERSVMSDSGEGAGGCAREPDRRCRPRPAVARGPLWGIEWRT